MWLIGRGAAARPSSSHWCALAYASEDGVQIEPQKKRKKTVA
jgi:hypothetical protein